MFDSVFHEGPTRAKHFQQKEHRPSADPHTAMEYVPLRQTSQRHYRSVVKDDAQCHCSLQTLYPFQWECFHKGCSLRELACYWFAAADYWWVEWRYFFSFHCAVPSHSGPMKPAIMNKNQF